MIIYLQCAHVVLKKKLPKFICFEIMSYYPLDIFKYGFYKLMENYYSHIDKRIIEKYQLKFGNYLLDEISNTEKNYLLAVRYDRTDVMIKYSQNVFYDKLIVELARRKNKDQFFAAFKPHVKQTDKLLKYLLKYNLTNNLVGRAKSINFYLAYYGYIVCIDKYTLYGFVARGNLPIVKQYIHWLKPKMFKFAARHGQLEMMNFLRENIKIKDKWYLLYGIKHLHIVKYALRHMTFAKKHLSKALASAAGNMEIAIVKELLDVGAKVPEYYHMLIAPTVVNKKIGDLINKMQPPEYSKLIY